MSKIITRAGPIADSGMDDSIRAIVAAVAT